MRKVPRNASAAEPSFSMAIGTIGDLGTKCSKAAHAKIPMAPRMRGRRVAADAHEYITPPCLYVSGNTRASGGHCHTHEIATRKMVNETMNIPIPIQSTFFRASSGCIGRCEVRKKATRTRLIPITGRQIQKIHLQVTLVVNPPPMTGPQQVPTSQTKLTYKIPIDRVRSVSKSAITTYVKARMPPPPVPCIVRPTRRDATLCAVPQMIVPTVNSASAVYIVALRTKALERLVKTG